MRVFKLKENLTVTELTNFNEFLEFYKTQPVTENDEKYIEQCAGDFIEVANLFLQYECKVYVVDNHADPLSFTIFDDWGINKNEEE